MHTGLETSPVRTDVFSCQRNQGFSLQTRQSQPESHARPHAVQLHRLCRTDDLEITGCFGHLFIICRIPVVCITIPSAEGNSLPGV